MFSQSCPGERLRSLGQFQVPLTYAYNLTVEKRISNIMTVRTAYVGSHSSHLFVDNDLNPPIHSRQHVGHNFAPSFPGYSDIGVASMSGNASYNSFQATIQRRVTKGITATANYTLSKSMDTLPPGNGRYHSFFRSRESICHTDLRCGLQAAGHWAIGLRRKHSFPASIVDVPAGEWRFLCAAIRPQRLAHDRHFSRRRPVSRSPSPPDPISHRRGC